MNEVDWTTFVARWCALVERAAAEFARVDDVTASSRPRAGAWSKKEILGHLVDSASNNHQRFVRARLQDALVFPGYDQDEWVRLEAWQNVPWLEIVELWRLYNLQLARLMLSTPKEERTRSRREHNLHELAYREHAADSPATLEWFYRDYVIHLEHHLRQSGLAHVVAT